MRQNGDDKSPMFLYILKMFFIMQMQLSRWPKHLKNASSRECLDINNIIRENSRMQHSHKMVASFLFPAFFLKFQWNKFLNNVVHNFLYLLHVKIMIIFTR
jgi:hypothetical protein